MTDDDRMEMDELSGRITVLEELVEKLMDAHPRLTEPTKLVRSSHAGTMDLWSKGEFNGR